MASRSHTATRPTARSKRSHARSKSRPAPHPGRKRRRVARARAKVRGGAATAAQAEAASLSPVLFVQSIIHVLGRTPGRAICGTPLPVEQSVVHTLGRTPGQANAPHGEVDAFEQHRALHALGDAMRDALAHFSGVGAVAVPCSGCVANAAKMKAAAEAKARASKVRQDGTAAGAGV